MLMTAKDNLFVFESHPREEYYFTNTLSMDFREFQTIKTMHSADIKFEIRAMINNGVAFKIKSDDLIKCQFLEKFKDGKLIYILDYKALV